MKRVSRRPGLHTDGNMRPSLCGSSGLIANVTADCHCQSRVRHPDCALALCSFPTPSQIKTSHSSTGICLHIVHSNLPVPPINTITHRSEMRTCTISPKKLQSRGRVIVITASAGNITLSFDLPP